MFPLLQIKNLRIDFVTELGTATAIDNISMEVNRGEIVGVAGESGSGKSVTSMAILRLLSSPPAKYVHGQILFSPDGISQFDMLSISQSALQSIRGSRIAMIFQEPMTSLNPVLTCGYQVMESILLYENPGREIARKKTLSLFEKVRLPDPQGLFNRYPHQLSGGQKQRVMIAMAMSGNPALLICDEPTTALDVTVQKTILELIRELQQNTGMGVIFITHDLGVIAGLANRVVVMYKGSIVEEGKTESVFLSPGHPYTKSLLACRPSLYTKGMRLPVVSDFMDMGASPSALAEQLSSPLTEQPSPGLAAQSFPAQAAESSPVLAERASAKKELSDQTTNPEAPLTTTSVKPPILLKAENLSVWFPAGRSFTGKPLTYIKAVDGVSFEVYEGETLGLVGESGCGKTTLGRTLLRLIEPTSGNILYHETPLASLKNSEMKKFRKHIQIIFQDPYSSLNPSLTIGSAIEEGLRVHRLLPTAGQRRERVIELLEKVNLHADHYHRYPHEFSGGQRQRIVIARALALKPSFIVCDESVSALDVSVQAQVLNLLNDLKKEFGFTSIFISHDLSVVRYVSDRIMVMNQGKIEETGNAEDVYNHPQKPYTRKLLEALPKNSLPSPA